ncbi:hypothetical protein ACS0TY_034155 [Phlomoides rotata]
MGCDNQPALTDIEKGISEHSITSKPKGEHPITSKPSGTDDCCWKLGAYGLSGPHIQGDFHSYPPDLNYMPDSKFDGDLINVKSEMSEFCRESELYPEVGMRGLDYAIDGSNFFPSDCLMNTDVNPMDYGKSEVYVNFMPPRHKINTCYPIKEHGAEAKNSTMSRIQRSGNFSSSECSTSLLLPVYNFGKSVTKNDINIGPLSFSKPQNVDGNFLTLGIGSGTEVRPNNNFSTQEISSTLEKASSDSHSSDSFVRHCAKNPMNLTQLTGRAGRIQTSAGGLSSSPCSLASRMPTRDECELIGDTRFRLNSVPSHGLQTPQANVQPNFSAKCFTSEFGLSPLSLPFGSSMISTPKHGTQPGLMSAYFTSQLIPGQQDYCRESSMMVSSESSRNYTSHRHSQSSISHLQLGRLIPLTGGGAQINASVNSLQSVQPARNLTSSAASIRTEAAKIGSFASSVHPVDTHNVNPVEELGNYLFPERNGFQNSKGGTSCSASAGPFPKRLGLQSDDFVTAGTSRGPPPFHLASPCNPVRPSASTGQYQHGVVPELSKDFPGVDCFNVAKVDAKPQAAPSVSHSSLKRKATKLPSTARLGQLRRIFSQHFAPGQRQSIQATPRTDHIPPTPLHVKWQGFDDERMDPRGEKCFLCKRDLSFTPEGLVFQPTAPPPVAVLPCGHTFHDHCLQIITPEDQRTSPPCIPCAIGGT